MLTERQERFQMIYHTEFDWATPQAQNALSSLHAQAQKSLGRLDDADSLRRLGDIQRMNGDFSTAREAYRRLCTLRPDDPSALWLHAITAGHPLPAPPTGVRAAPFVRIPNFLTPAEAARLLSWAQDESAHFKPARVIAKGGKYRIDTSIRRGLALPRRFFCTTEISAWLVSKVRNLLPTVSAQLRLPDLDDRQIVLTTAAYLNGGYGLAHRDPVFLIGNCYFHTQPRRFFGGELLLHDTDFETGEPQNCGFSRIAPVSGSIIFYPGAYFHEITPVTCETDHFVDARFAVSFNFRPR